MKFLDREATIAKPGFNRWLVPPAALAVHLAIGQIYAYSVFNAPLTKLIGITESAAAFLCRQSASIRTICFCFI